MNNKESTVTELYCYQHDFSGRRIGIYAHWGGMYGAFFEFERDNILEIKIISENKIFLRTTNGAYNITFITLRELLERHGYAEGENNGK